MRVTEPTVVLLPATDPRHAGLRGQFLNGRFPVLAVTPSPGPDRALAARICAAIASLAPAPPLVLVAIGSAGLLLPAVALAQRAGHRRVASYLLIDAELPAVTDSWPDAPVTVLADGDQRLPALRGWDVRPLAEIGDWLPGP